MHLALPHALTTATSPKEARNLETRRRAGCDPRTHKVGLSLSNPGLLPKGTVLSIFGIEPFRIGGQEAFARELSAQLAEHGWKSVLCWAGEPPRAVRSYLELPNVTLEVLDTPEVANWEKLRALARIMRRHRPAIVHLYYTGFLGPYPWLARGLGAQQVLFTDQGSRPEGYLPQRAPGWKRAAARIINFPMKQITCVSGYGHRCFTALDLLPAERFVMIYNAVDLGRVTRDAERASRFRRKYSIPEGRAVVAQVSWIIPEKGILDLLEAARLVLAQKADVQFVFVGEGAYREQYMQRANALGMGGHVTWTGTIEDPFSEGVYAASDIVCQLSRWEEVFGYSIAEAMASGRPVVGTAVGGIPELVQDGESGFLAPRGNAQQIAAKILTLLEDDNLRRQMGEAGRRIAETKFDLKKNVAQLIRLYGIAAG